MNVNLLPVEVEDWEVLKLHNLCSMFPPMQEEDYESLVQSIKHNGFLESDPIVLIEVDGEMQVLDGRNRLNAAIDSKTTPCFVEYVNDDPLGFVLARNMDRRHLTTGQKAALATRLLEMGKQVKQTDAAKALGIGEATIRRFQWVSKHKPDLAEKVAKGEVPLEAARKQVREDVPKPERFRDRKKRELEEQRKAKQAESAEDRQTMEVQIAATVVVSYTNDYASALAQTMAKLERAGLQNIDVITEGETQ